MRDPRLLELLSDRSISLTTGVFDPLSAMIAERAGFAAAMLSGYSVAATMLGEPDLGILTQTEMLEVARRTVAAVRMPILVDGDTGGGGVVNVQRLVRELVDMGAAGVFLEDQVWPKRCGHMRGKAIVPMEEHVEKLRAAADARGDADLIIVGRTDARAVAGLDEAIRRGHAYKAAGADLIFIEAPQSIEEMQRITAELPPPLLVNMVEGGHTPLLPLAELGRLGFQIAVYPVSAVLAVARTLERVYGELAARGDTTTVAGELMAFEDLTDLLGMQQLDEAARRFRAS
ncbi:MAG TPA: oxaloacetate decarboxylase [Candidatus Binatia bacterium]|nr:oxaloacetate decarboxylase [Candidatus Binatia bacterium]